MTAKSTVPPARSSELLLVKYLLVVIFMQKFFSLVCRSAESLGDFSNLIKHKMACSLVVKAALLVHRYLAFLAMKTDIGTCSVRKLKKVES